MAIRLKRVYDPPEEDDGYRVLVERLWPRGVSKERARVDRWVKDAGASNELRTWYGHDPAKWEEFRQKYAAEMRERPAVMQELAEILEKEANVTFLFSAHDTERNNAVALRDILMKGR